MFNNWLKLYKINSGTDFKSALSGVKKKHKIEKRHYSENEKIEIIKFYQMLVKMKKSRPNFNVDRIIKMLYPNLDIDFSSCLLVKSIRVPTKV
jgi:hypothetical protein